MSKSWRFTTYHDYKDGEKDDSEDGGSSSSGGAGSEPKKVDVKHPTSDNVDNVEDHRKTDKELPERSPHKSEGRHKHKKHRHKSHKKEKRKDKSRSHSRDRDRRRSRSRSRERRDESRDKSRRHYRNHREDDRSSKYDKRPSYHESRPSQSRSSDHNHGGSHSSSAPSTSRGGFRDSRGRYVDPSKYVDDRLKSGPLPVTDKSQSQAASLGLKTVPIEAVKLKEEIEKRKLLWSKKEKPAEAVVPVVWKQTAFSDDKDGKVSEKFRRLMGMKGEGGTFVGPQNKDDSSPEKAGSSSVNQDEYFANLERQYEVARATTHTQRGLGLGFSARKYL